MSPQMMNIRHAPKKAMRNKEAIELAGACGCYACLEVFLAKDVTKWTDNSETAVCPHCSKDCVLPGITNAEELRTINAYWLPEPVKAS